MRVQLHDECLDFVALPVVVKDVDSRKKMLHEGWLSSTVIFVRRLFRSRILVCSLEVAVNLMEVRLCVYHRFLIQLCHLIRWMCLVPLVFLSYLSFLWVCVLIQTQNQSRDSNEMKIKHAKK